MAHITSLAAEIRLHILSYIAQQRDLNSLSCCCRSIYWWASNELFNRAVRQQSARKDLSRVLTKIVAHAIKYDSQHIIEWLSYHELGSRLNGYVNIHVLEYKYNIL